MAVLGGHLRVPVTGELRGDAVVSEVVIERGPDPIGPADFVFTATELHARTTGDVIKDARRASPDRTRVAPGPVANGIRIAWTYDETKWNGQVAIPLVAPVLVHPDGTVQRFVFRIGPRLAAKRDAYAARARAMIEGIIPGPPVATGPATIELEDGIVVDVPKEYAYVREIPMERQVRIRIDRLRPIGEAAALLTLQATPAGPNSAALIKAMRALDPVDAIRTPGVLLGQSIEWTSWRSGPRPDERTLRAIVQRGAREITVNVFSPDRSSQRVLRAIAETLRGR